MWEEERDPALFTMSLCDRESTSLEPPLPERHVSAVAGALGQKPKAIAS